MLRIREIDRELLRWLVRMHLANVKQVARWWRSPYITAWKRCTWMEAAGLLRSSRPFAQQGIVFTVTDHGAGLAHSELPAYPEVYPARFWDTLAAVSLSLELRDAHPGSTWISERELRHERGKVEREASARHVPTGVLVGPDGRRVAIDLDLAEAPRRRLDEVFLYYGRTREYDAVRFLAPAAAVRGAAERLVREGGLEHVSVEGWTVPPEAAPIEFKNQWTGARSGEGVGARRPSAARARDGGEC